MKAGAERDGAELVLVLEAVDAHEAAENERAAWDDGLEELSRRAADVGWWLAASAALAARGRAVRPHDLDLIATPSERRGLDDRVRLIREALA